jgi:hypothetical protein
VQKEDDASPGYDESPERNESTGPIFERSNDTTPSYEEPPVLSGNVSPDPKYARYKPIFTAAGLHYENWALFCEWTARKGYRIDKLVAQGREVYYQLVSEFNKTYIEEK